MDETQQECLVGWLIVDTKGGKRVNHKCTVVNVAFTKSILGTGFHRYLLMDKPTSTEVQLGEDTR